MKSFLSYTFVICSLLSSSFLSDISYGAEAENIQENIHRLGFDRFYSSLKKDRNKEQVKIAIFDYGFEGYQDEKGETIPKNTVFKQNPSDTNKTSGKNNTHGLAMAQILTQYMTNNYTSWRLAPKIYLYKSDGYSNFEWAINDAIKNHVDIILHSIVIEYGSNYDGKGFYNALVNKATDTGIVWVNAAGNFGLTTYNSDVAVAKNHWVKLDDLETNALPVKCALPKRSKEKNCKIRVVLAWDDFKDKPMLGTKKDLDLYLYDNNFESSVSSQLMQVNEDNPMAKTPGHTLYPREIIETNIKEGISYIKVKAESDNFASTDRLRITADGDNIQFQYRDSEESILNPADNATVITVGEDSERSSVSRSLDKPELLAPSLVLGDDGKRYKGSSNAAAVVAAGIGLMKKMNSNLDREAILDLASRGNASPENIMNYPRPMAPRAPIVVPMGPPGYSPPELNATFIQSQVIASLDAQYNPPKLPPDSSAHSSFYRDDRHKSHSRDRKDYQEDDDYYRDEGHHDHHQRNDDGNDRQGDMVMPINPYSIPTKVLRFGPLQGNGCFALADIKAVEPCVIGNFIIKSQSLLVVTTAGLKIATSFDPILLIPGDQRLDIRDVIAILPTEGNPFRRLRRNAPMPPGAIEIFKMPIEEMICKIPDWNFLMTELDISRRRVFEANASGPYNHYIPQACRVDVLAGTAYPVSNWSMYPVLQTTPFVAPIGPAPMEIRSSYQDRPNERGDDQNLRRAKRQGENFQLPDPDDVRDEE